MYQQRIFHASVLQAYPSLHLLDWFLLED
ncbi:hypothetical protein Goshw_016322 [Gossypium schwendimanii]|uniref:Uncharacterized protein n=1 Tax=Gossypium schwendimanii TaxID=34291 RepID=A0A7J9L3T9_GOSSC|nr:hypothetical protein [Gossypium schwendimanii]